MIKIADYEIIDHGYDHAQYFQGCGTAFTDYDVAITGAGNNAKEAYEDALEQVYMMGYDGDKLPKRPRGINARHKAPAVYYRDEENEFYYYVSIRIRVKHD